jgi:type I restriction enzyme S subunit
LNTSNAQPLITSTKIKSIDISVPSLKEQEEIADYLDKKCSEIDQLISIKQQKIVELNDYKKSLIYEYTTGKKEVKL